MEIILHAHHAEVTESLRTKAERAIERLATRVRRVVTAIVRFEGDGPSKRVEIVLQAPRRPDIVAHAFDRQYEPALSLAVQRLEAQVARARRSRRPRSRPPETPPW
jgi:ribosome-associated translation inhibitor RaiA